MTDAEKIEALREALALLYPVTCDNLHHSDAHQHSEEEECPVIAEANRLIDSVFPLRCEG